MRCRAGECEEGWPCPEEAAWVAVMPGGRVLPVCSWCAPSSGASDLVPADSRGRDLVSAQEVLES